MLLIKPSFFCKYTGHLLRRSFSEVRPYSSDVCKSAGYGISTSLP